MDRFHNALPNVKSAFVILQNFTPDLQQIYTDISDISVTFRNSAPASVQLIFPPSVQLIFPLGKTSKQLIFQQVPLFRAVWQEAI